MYNLVPPKRLAAFDFDNTVVNGNTDAIVRDLIKFEIPSKVNDLITTKGWICYMEEIFRILHKNKVTREEILSSVREIPEVPGFVKLLKSLYHANFDIIIISDSNTVFIREWIKTHHIEEIITQLFTNPACFLEDGLLTIKPYHYQTECKLSAENLCKGKILDNFITKRQMSDSVIYENIIYVGDGTNDICPVIRLREKDLGCARKGFSMMRILEKNKRTKLSAKSKIIFWENGFDLAEQLQSILQYKK